VLRDLIQMSSGAALPPPPAVVQVKGFASDFDKAERASSSLQSSLTASTLCTERDIPRCRIKGNQSIFKGNDEFKTLITGILSYLQAIIQSEKAVEQA
jgi:hypothetical protein